MNKYIYIHIDFTISKLDIYNDLFNHYHLLSLQVTWTAQIDLAGLTHAFQSDGGLTGLDDFVLALFISPGGLGPSPYSLSSTTIRHRLLHLRVTTAAGEDKPQYAKAVQVSTRIMHSIIPLAKPRFRWEGIQRGMETERH